MSWQDHPCIPWGGKLGAEGYGRIHLRSYRSKRAHVVAWEKANGPVPDGLVLDHLCRNRACVNPLHLEPVTVKENTLRGIGPTAQNAKKTVCVQGHPLEGDNLKLRANGARICRECARQFWMKQRAIQKVVGRFEDQVHKIEKARGTLTRNVAADGEVWYFGIVTTTLGYVYVYSEPKLTTLTAVRDGFEVTRTIREPLTQRGLVTVSRRFIEEVSA